MTTLISVLILSLFASAWLNWRLNSEVNRLRKENENLRDDADLLHKSLRDLLLNIGLIDSPQPPQIMLDVTYDYIETSKSEQSR
jgi:hypothetical protein